MAARRAQDLRGLARALVLLFRVGRAMPEADVVAALGAARVGELLAAGFLARDRGDLRPRVAVVPFDGLLLAGDGHESAGRADFVAASTESARWLAELTVRRRVRRALDIGVGSGIHALLAASHAERVVGTDVNPRALEIGRFNAALNGIDRLELREGAWLEPVEGERFDLVVSNPPFAVSPGSELLFRDSGMPGDAALRELLRGLPGHMTDGGLAQVIGDWICDDPADPAAPLRDWLAASGCDVLVLWRQTLDPLEYAAGWHADAAELDAGLERWVRHHAEHGISSVARGMVLLRKRTSGDCWFHALEEANGSRPPANEGVERAIAGCDALATLDDAGLARARLALAPGLHVDQRVAYDDRGFRMLRAAVSARPGLGIEALVDPDVLDVLFELPDAGSLAAAAEAAEGGAVDLLPPALCAARDLLARGLLLATD